jgi:Flp pilus assembly protein TadD
MASTISQRRVLRRIPALRSLSSRELEDLYDKMVYRFYPVGTVIWRTRGPLRFSGYLQSGEIELEYRLDGLVVRRTWLRAGDPLPPRPLQLAKLRNTVIATATTDVRLGILPQMKQAAAATPDSTWKFWLWPVLLLLLIVTLARADLARIASGLIYLESQPAESSASADSGSMSLLHAAQKVDGGAAFAYNEEGYRRFQQGRLPDAEAAFVQALSRDPGNAPALNNLGIAYFAQGILPQASSSLQQAVQYNPDNSIPRYNLGITLMQQDSSAALREFREASFIDPGDSPALLQQAYLYLQAGNYIEAEQSARLAQQLDPSLTPAHMLLGIALYNQGKEAEALFSFTQALSLQPGNRTAAFYQALILGHQKQYAAALPILQDLFVSSPDPSQSARILAEIDALYRFQADLAAAGR